MSDNSHSGYGVENRLEGWETAHAWRSPVEILRAQMRTSGGQWGRYWPECHSQLWAEPALGRRSESQSLSRCWFLCAGADSSQVWPGAPSPEEKGCGLRGG